MTNGRIGDGVRDEALDIARTAEDLADARTSEVGREAGLADLDGCIAASTTERERLHATIVAMTAERDDLDVRLVALRGERAGVEAQVRSLHDREVEDERQIAADLATLKGDLDDAGGGLAPVTQPTAPPAPATFQFFVDGNPYETDQARMSGLQIKARVADWVPSHDLSLEGTGTVPDRIVPDGEEVDFAGATAPLYFSSVPKASFG